MMLMPRRWQVVAAPSAVGQSLGLPRSGASCSWLHLQAKKQSASIFGSELLRFAGVLDGNGAFERFLEAATGVLRSGTRQPRPEVRRFRPGDYLRAGSRPTSMRLDVVLCLGAKRRWRRLGAADVFAEAKSAPAGGLLEGPEGVLPLSPLLRAAPVANTLRVVLVDDKTEHLVEPVSAAAVASRWDVAMAFEVHHPEGACSSSEDQDMEGGEEEPEAAREDGAVPEE